MAPHSSTLAWKIPWMEEPSRLRSMGLLRVDKTEWLHFHISLSCIGEGNGNPLQYSCLENPRDGGAWWAAISGVTQSRTRLKRLSNSSSSSSPCLNPSVALEKNPKSWQLQNLPGLAPRSVSEPYPMPTLLFKPHWLTLFPSFKYTMFPSVPQLFQECCCLSGKFLFHSFDCPSGFGECPSSGKASLTPNTGWAPDAWCFHSKAPFL